MGLGVDVSKGCAEYNEEGVGVKLEAVGVEFGDYGGFWVAVEVGGRGKVAGDVSTRLAIRW